MSIELSLENSRYIAKLVESGAYVSETHALNEAVLLLRKREELRMAVQAGIGQADRGELIPAEDVFRHLEQRAAHIEQSAHRP